MQKQEGVVVYHLFRWDYNIIPPPTIHTIFTRTVNGYKKHNRYLGAAGRPACLVALIIKSTGPFSFSVYRFRFPVFGFPVFRFPVFGSRFSVFRYRYSVHSIRYSGYCIPVFRIRYSVQYSGIPVFRYSVFGIFGIPGSLLGSQQGSQVPGSGFRKIFEKINIFI